LGGKFHIPRRDEKGTAGGEGTQSEDPTIGRRDPPTAKKTDDSDEVRGAKKDSKKMKERNRTMLSSRGV